MAKVDSVNLLRQLGPRILWPAFALAALGGCAGQGNAENHNAEAVAVEFFGSVSADAAKACGLLAPQTRAALEDTNGDCTDVLADEVHASTGPAQSVQVYGKDAIVHLPDDTIFLARFAGGWRVTAAGCTEQPNRPYDCKVEGN